MNLSMTAKIAMGAAGAGLVGGIVAERMTSGGSIERSKEADVWNRLHDDFLTRHPAPEGVHMYVGSEPAWKNAAISGGAAAGVAALGGGMMLLARKMQPTNQLLSIAGLGVAALGLGAAAGVGASWGVR